MRCAKDVKVPVWQIQNQDFASIVMEQVRRVNLSPNTSCWWFYYYYREAFRSHVAKNILHRPVEKYTILKKDFTVCTFVFWIRVDSIKLLLNWCQMILPSKLSFNIVSKMLKFVLYANVVAVKLVIGSVESRFEQCLYLIYNVIFIGWAMHHKTNQYIMWKYRN